MNTKQSSEAFLSSNLHEITEKKTFYQKKPLWRLLISKDFFFSFILLIFARIFMVFLGFFPPILIDSYLRSLSQLKPSEKDVFFVYYQGFAIIFLLYAQGFFIKNHIFFIISIFF